MGLGLLDSGKDDEPNGVSAVEVSKISVTPGDSFDATVRFDGV